MISSSAASGHQWHQRTPKDAEVGPDAASSASSTAGVFSPQVIMERGWNAFRGVPSKPSRPFGLPTTLILSIIMMALTYLMFRCGQQFATEHPVSRHLAAATELGAIASCIGRGAKSDDEYRAEEQGKLEETELRARVEDTLKALEDLAGSAEQAMHDLDPPTWLPAASIMLSFAYQELMAFAGFLDSKLEGKRQRAVRRFQAFRGRLVERVEIQYTRSGAGRALKRFNKVLKDAFRSPSWAAFPSDQPTRKLLQDLIVMTSMGIEACQTAVLALAPSSGIHETGAVNQAIELLRIIRKTRLRQLLATPELSCYMEEMRRKSERQGLYSDADLADAREAGPKPLEQNIAEFNSLVGKCNEDLKQRMHPSDGSQSHAAPPTHSTIAHGPLPPSQPVQQAPGAVRQQPPVLLQSVPSAMPPQGRQPSPMMSHEPLPPFPPLRPFTPSQYIPAPDSPARAPFVPGFTPRSHAHFSSGHLQTGPMTSRAPTFPFHFQVVAFPPFLPAVPLPFARPPYGVIHQMPSAGANFSMPPYPIQQTGVAGHPSSTQPGAKPPPGVHPPRGNQRISWSLAPGAHRVSAAFYGHPLGTPADPETSETNSQALPVLATPSGDVHEEERKELNHIL